MQTTHDDTPYASAKVKRDDYRSYRGTGKELRATIVEMFGIGRLLIESTPKKKRVELLRKVREQGVLTN